MALWTPAEITTALWLDAADAGTITEVSGAVSQWDDKSGNARHATQGSATSRPVYTASAIGGLAALRFDGSNDYLTHDVIQANPSLLTVYVVANASSSSDGNIWSHRSEVQRLINLRALSGGSGASALARGSGNSLQTVTSTKASGSPRIYAMEFDRAGTNFEIIVDGEPGTSSSYNFGVQTLTSTKNSISGTDSGAGHVILLDGDVGEVVITEANHDPIIEGYLAWKWGLEANLPSGHPYEDAAPTTGITGSGTPASQSATTSGTATRTVTGTGAPQSQSSSTDGSATTSSETSGSGAAQAQSSTVSGTAVRTVTASGTPTAQDATASGTAIRSVTGAGTPTAQASTTTGSGELAGPATGEGTVQAQHSTTTGVALRVITGSGSLTSAASTTVGVGQGGAVVTGSGTPQSQPSTSTGTATRVISGSGAVQAQSSTMSGTSIRTIFALGAIAANDSAITGAAQRVITGTGAVSPSASTVSGFDIFTLSPVTFVVEDENRTFTVGARS